MIPYSRAKRSDLYALSQSKLLENHTLNRGTYLYSPYMAVPPPPAPSHPGYCNTSSFSVRLRYHLLRTARDLRVLPFISRPWERAYGTKSLHSTASIRPSAGITPLFMKVTIFVLASIFSHFPVQSTTSQQIPIILRTRTKLIKRYR